MLKRAINYRLSVSGEQPLACETVRSCAMWICFRLAADSQSKESRTMFLLILIWQSLLGLLSSLRATPHPTRSAHASSRSGRGYSAFAASRAGRGTGLDAGRTSELRVTQLAGRRSAPPGSIARASGPPGDRFDCVFNMFKSRYCMITSSS